MGLIMVLRIEMKSSMVPRTGIKSRELLKKLSAELMFDLFVEFPACPHCGGLSSKT